MSRSSHKGDPSEEEAHNACTSVNGQVVRLKGRADNTDKIFLLLYLDSMKKRSVFSQGLSGEEVEK